MDARLRARLFIAAADGSDAYTYGGEIDAVDADDVWRIVQRSPETFGRMLHEGDIVYIADVYLKLDGDGGWQPLPPSELTQMLYALVTGGTTDQSVGGA